MKNVLCSTGSLLGRANGRDFSLLPTLEHQISCDGFELMFYDSWYNQIDSLFRTVKNLRKPILVFHSEKNICNGLLNEETKSLAEEHFRINCQFASAMQIKTMVFHLWDGRMTDEQILSTLLIYPRLNQIASEHGILLAVENIVSTINSPLHYCNKLLSAHPDVLFTYDTKMSAFHCENDALFEEGNLPFAKRICHLHINDYAGGYMDWQNFKTLHIGDGRVNFPPIIQFLKSIPYQGYFTTEATAFDQSGWINIDKLNLTLKKLKDFIQE